MTSRIPTAQLRAEWLGTASHRRQVVGSKRDTFADQIDSSMSSQRSSEASGGAATRQESGTAGVSSQDTAAATRSNPSGYGFIVNYGPGIGAADTPASRSTVAPTSTSDTTSGKKKSEASAPAEIVDPVARLGEALRSAGLDPSTFGISSHEDVVWCPGGNYLNKTLSVSLPNGRSERFMTDITGAYPDVTVNEIKRLLNMPGPEFA